MSLAPLILVAGCGKKQSAVAPPSNNVFRIAMTTDPTTFDPAMVQDGTTIDMLQQVFEGLVQWNTHNTVEPALAVRWEISPNRCTYTFHLRQGANFQNGLPVTAADVYNSMRRALDPKLASPVALSYLGDIVGAADVASGKATVLTGVKVINPQTVAITIKKPKAYWIDTLTYPTAYVISLSGGLHTDRELSEADVAQGIASGPFKLSSYTKDVEVNLDAYAGYWAGAPKIAGQRRPIVRDADTRRSMYLAGQLDLVDEQADDTAKDAADPSLKSQLKFWPRAQTFYIGLNEKSFPPFADVRVRQALAYATDKQKIRSVALLDIDDVAQDILPEGMPGFDPQFQGLPYDPAKARALLAAAGYPNGKSFPQITISYRESYPVLADTVDLIRQMWQTNLGISVQGKVTNWTVLLDQEDRGLLTCYHIRWAADYPDPQDFYSVLLRTGSIEDYVGYSNPKYDALCDAADICPDNTKRMALYHQAAQIIANDVPMIPLYYAKDVELVKPYVHNLDDGLMGHLPYLHLSLGG